MRAEYHNIRVTVDLMADIFKDPFLVNVYEDNTELMDELSTLKSQIKLLEETRLIQRMQIYLKDYEQKEINADYYLEKMRKSLDELERLGWLYEKICSNK